jgi:cell division protein ZapD
VILYEYPFNERIRTYLRLEHMFRRLAELMAREHPLDHHFAIQTLFEIVDMATRSDLKSDILKDLDRQKQLFNSYRGNPAISEAALDRFITQLDHCFTQLHEDTAKPGQTLSEIEWLHSVRTRMAIPGGTCEFDLPLYHDWMHRPVAGRQRDLGLWVQELARLAEPVQLLLSLLRDSGVPQKVLATQGQFQQNLPSGKTYQLLRLWIDPRHERIPEISANRLMISVRLLQRGSDGRPSVATDPSTAFEIMLCT